MPEIDRQDVVGEELGVLVGEADAGGDAARAVHELVLVELVAERDRQQEEPAEDREVDPDRASEDAVRRASADEVAGRASAAGPRRPAPLNSAWTSRRNGSSNRKKPMSLAEDRIGDRPRRSGENGTWWIQSRTVSQAADDASRR